MWEGELQCTMFCGSGGEDILLTPFKKNNNNIKCMNFYLQFLKYKNIKFNNKYFSQGELIIEITMYAKIVQKVTT